ncbi:MAG: magnesium transporter CorA family protein [Clostridia bacterium]
MINYYIAENSKVEKILEIQNACWINMIDPTEKEINYISEKLFIDADALKAALDEEERARVEIEDEYQMIVVDVPTSEEKHGKQSYITIPLSIIVLENHLITVCTEDTGLLSHFEDGRIKNFYTRMKTRFILQILYRNASMFLSYLRSIDKKTDIVKNRLHKSTQNKELIQLLELEKSLLYFTTSLKGNQVVLDKLLKNPAIKRYEEDEDLLEDTIIENSQAIEMAGIYSGILRGMMDCFASVISNNLNRVMKLLAAMTIIMSIPTMIFSALGMNVIIPFGSEPWAFAAILFGSVLFSGIITFIFYKAKMFK